MNYLVFLNARVILTFCSVATTRQPAQVSLVPPRTADRFSRTAPHAQGAGAAPATGRDGARNVFPGVGEVHVLRNQEAAVLLRGRPDIRIAVTSELFGLNRVDIVAERLQRPRKVRRDVLVQFELQRLTRTSATGRSS